MSKQQSTSRRFVAFAAAFLVFAIAVFAAAFWYFDGVGYVSGLISGGSSAPTPAAPPSSQPTSTAQQVALPSGMPEEFALRLWQDQIDSRATIKRLVNGEIKSMAITKVETSGAQAVLDLRVTFTDGGTVEGFLGLERFGDTYYIATVNADRGKGFVPVPPTNLPVVDDVDVPLLNTILTEQTKSASNIQEYVDGKVKAITLLKPKAGLNTVTIPIVMNEDHETGYAEIVVISQEIDGQTEWFVARFSKTGSEPLNR